MSYFNFIASDYEMPGVDNTDKHRMTVKKAVDRGLMTNEYDLPLDSEVLIYETEEEFDELMIHPSDFINDKVVRTHTKKSYLNDVHLGSCECHYEALLCYLYENMKPGTTVELWKIWVSELEKPIVKTINLQNLTIQHLDIMLKHQNKTNALFIKN